MTADGLVLAGGGVAGIAWEIGILFGIQEGEPDAAAELLAETTTFVGTSAGSAVAAQVASGTPLSELFAAQVSDESAELSVDIDLEEFAATMARVAEGATSPEEIRRRLGTFALNADTVSPQARKDAIVARLPVPTWSTRRVLITAVDARSGELQVFDRNSGVELFDAVGASCAVPGVWPTVEIGGHRYMDGGMRTLANADLAAGSERVLILVPGAEDTPFGRSLPDSELDALAPARVHAVFADADSIAAFGTNPLDPRARRPSAIAGREQGRRVAPAVAAFWRG